MELCCHPATPARAIQAVRVDCERSGLILRLSYEVVGDTDALLATDHPAGRRDDLWRHTCFEAFVRAAGSAYREFNLAPSGAWAAYDFDDYRDGMRDAAADPVLAWSGTVLSATVTPSLAGDWQANLTAVIEERDGTRSYWALAHPAGKPDFHDPACFVLALPAAD